MKKLPLLFAVALISTVACTRTYDCQCNIDGPDSAGVNLDFDTTFQITGRIEEEAQIKCEGFEQAQALLGSQFEIEELEDVQVDCTFQ